MKKTTIVFILIFVNLLFVNLYSQRPMEYLDRSLIPMETNSGVYLTWRMLGTDPADIGFNLYRDGVKINDNPITETTNYTDSNGKVNSLYQVETIWADGENEMSDKASVWALYPSVASPGKAPVPLKRIVLPPAPVIEGVEFVPGDMSVGDLDGDGQYELIFEWEASNGKNSFLEAIDLDGNSLWRINTGPNVTTTKLNMMVYDLNMDGKAEVAIFTGPGTIDGKGNYINKGPAANYSPNLVIPRHQGATGNLLEDPQFITLFNGETGEVMATVEHWKIGPKNQMKATWGDDYGHRASSLKGAVLYNMEHGPLLVYGRGVYARVAYTAYKWDGADGLDVIWKFDSHAAGNSAYSGQGNHSVAVGDLDGDGNDELIYGAAAIDHDGKGLYSTGFGHGDTHALSDLDPDNPGLEYYQTHEGGSVGISMRSAGTGEILWKVDSNNDIGRGWAADVDPLYPIVAVGIGLGNYNNKGVKLSADYNAYDQPLYFYGGVQKARRNQDKIDAYGAGRILTAWYYGAKTIHSTKNDANLVADILGDWREEIIFPTSDNKALLIFSSWFPTERKNPTLMHDPVYRMNVAVQNVGYNQPAHVGYYFRDGYPKHNIQVIDKVQRGQSEYVKDLYLLDLKNASKWEIVKKLIKDDKVYSDMDFFFADGPEYLYNKQWIRPSAESRKVKSPNELAYFTAKSKTSVFVVHQKSITNKPEWLSDWTLTDEVVNVMNESGAKVPMNLYERTFEKDEVINLGVNTNDGASGRLMYFVVINNGVINSIDINSVVNDNVHIYPNPFNNITNVEFTLSSEQDVEITLNDISGRLIQIVEKGSKTPGKHVIPINGSGLNSGVYLVKISVGYKVYYKKIICD